MRIETVCTGDELLTGLTADTNSAFFQTLLLDEMGVTVRHGAVVGDVDEEIVNALQVAGARADAVLVSGGLGPTADDITAACAAKAAGVELVEHEPTLIAMRERFARRGVVMTANNARQALVPAGAEVVNNPNGTAPMFALRIGRAHCYFVPGVPREYQHLVQYEVLPRLRALDGASVGRAPRRLRLLKTVGLPESHLDERVKGLAAAYPGVRIGFRTHGAENQLKLLSESGDEVELNAAVAEARALLGEYLFAEGDVSLASAVLGQLSRCGESVAVAESCTGGGVAALLTAEAGASANFVGGVVAYASAIKTSVLGVPADVLAEHSAVSNVVALHMARGVRALMNAHWGVATTGIAGPDGGTAKTPVGTVFVAVAGRATERVYHHRIPGRRERIQELASAYGVDALRRALSEEHTPQ